MKFLRFGEVPKNGKSINFLKLTFEQIDDFTSYCNILGYDEAVASLPESAFEDGVSVFKIDSQGLPVLENLQQASSLSERLKEHIFEVEGDIVGTGNDGEPLVFVKKIVKKRRIKREKLIDLILTFLIKNFKSSEKTGEMPENPTLRTFYTTYKINKKTGEKARTGVFDKIQGDDWVICPEVVEYMFGGWTFSNPADGFNVNMGLNG